MLTNLLRILDTSRRRTSILALLNRADRATDRVRDLIDHAIELADSLDSPSVDSRHMLSGTVAFDSVASRVLSELDLSSEKLISGITASLAATHPSQDALADLAIAMKSAENWALHFNRKVLGGADLQYVGTEHLLLGLATHGTLSSTVLADFGIETVLLCDQIDQMFRPTS